MLQKRSIKYAAHLFNIRLCFFQEFVIFLVIHQIWHLWKRPSNQMKAKSQLEKDQKSPYLVVNIWLVGLLPLTRNVRIWLAPEAAHANENDGN